jgi:hypothetical protein
MRMLAAAFAMAMLGGSSPPPAIAGSWSFTFEVHASSALVVTAPEPASCVLRQTGSDLKGSCGSNGLKLMGKVSGHQIMLRVSSSTLSGVLSKDGVVIAGTWHDHELSGKFSATRD